MNKRPLEDLVSSIARDHHGVRGAACGLLVALVLPACLPTPKKGCRTTDDCLNGRVCVGNICRERSRDAGDDTGLLPSADATEHADLAADLAGDVSFGWNDAYPPLFGRPDAPPPPDTPVVDPLDTDAGNTSAPGDPRDSSDTGPTVLPWSPEAHDASPEAHETSSDPPSDPKVESPPDAPIPERPDDPPPQDPGVERGPDARDGPLSWPAFFALVPRAPWNNALYIIDGDLVLDELGLRRYYDDWFATAAAPVQTFAPMGAHSQWPPADAIFLSYCISPEFGGATATVQAALEAAAFSWSRRLNVTFVHLAVRDADCTPDNPAVVFDVRPVSAPGYLALSFSPDSPRAARSLLIQASLQTPAASADLEASLRHQLGHMLGFQHEHLWLDPACTSQDLSLAVRVANYDVDSVMHYPSCRAFEGGGVTQTEGDYLSAVAAYGLSPMLLTTINSL